MVKSIQGHHSGLLVCTFLKGRLVRSRVPEDGIWGTSLTYSLVADPIAEPGEGLWAGGRQLPHLFPESALELSPVLWCHQGPCKENGTGWDVAEENCPGDGVHTQPGRESPSAHACSHWKPCLGIPTNLGVNLNSENESMESEVSRVLTFGKKGKESLGKGLERDFRRVKSIWFLDLTGR